MCVFPLPMWVVIKRVGVDSDETHKMDGLGSGIHVRRESNKQQPATCNLCVESDFPR